MSDRNEKPSQRRSYPGSYDKLIPIALAIIVVAIVAVLTIVVIVALGLAPGAN